MSIEFLNNDYVKIDSLCNILTDHVAGGQASDLRVRIQTINKVQNNTPLKSKKQQMPRRPRLTLMGFIILWK